jgi:hypothetical protein
VAFWSGESGRAVIRETGVRIAKGRGLELGELPIWWGFNLPKLSVDEHLALFADVIRQHAFDIAICDPLYLSLLDGKGGGNASDLYYMGSVLEPLTDITQDLGVTLGFLHHFRKTGPAPADDEPVGLEELAQSGVAEWCRQWILLARRAPYQHDGNHQLWCRLGGSAGHAGLYGVNVDEGILNPETFTGRYWDVSVETVTDVREHTRRDKEDRKAKMLETRHDEHRQRLLKVLKRLPEGETVRQLRLLTGLNAENFARAIDYLFQEGRAEQCQVRKQNVTYDGFRAVPNIRHT